MTTNLLRALTHGAVAVAALGIACGACAQGAQDGSAQSVVGSGAKSGQSFIGIAVGKATYGTSAAMSRG